MTGDALHVGWCGRPHARPILVRHVVETDLGRTAALTKAALQTDGCRGWSIGVYNPDLDPENREAQRIVAYLAEVLGHGGCTGSAP